MKISGIYKITNTINGKEYYGSSSNISARWNWHTTRLKLNKHSNIHLQRAWNKYGKDKFKFEIVKKCPKEQLEEIEQFYLCCVKMAPHRFYNISTDSEAFTRGMKFSDLTKKRMSLAHKGKNTWMLGRKLSEATRKKMSISARNDWNRRKQIQLNKQNEELCFFE